jgi:hypothetical protein
MVSVIPLHERADRKIDTPNRRKSSSRSGRCAGESDLVAVLIAKGGLADAVGVGLALGRSSSAISDHGPDRLGLAANPRSNRYTLTADGTRIAIFYTKIYNRLLIPLTASDQPQASTTFGAMPAGSGQTRTASVTSTNLTSATRPFGLSIDTATGSGVMFSVSPLSVTLAAGAPVTVTIMMTTAQDADMGDHFATLGITSGGVEVAHAVVYTLVK